MFFVLNCSGGRHCKRPVKAFEVYDTEMRSWTTLPTMPCKRSYGGIIWDPDGRLCLLGGLRQGGGHQSSKFTKNVNIFDSNQGTKLRLSSLTHTQTAGPHTVLNLKLYFKFHFPIIALALRDDADIMGISISMLCPLLVGFFSSCTFIEQRPWETGEEMEEIRNGRAKNQ